MWWVAHQDEEKKPYVEAYQAEKSIYDAEKAAAKEKRRVAIDLERQVIR